jgi:hypothetical protein
MIQNPNIFLLLAELAGAKVKRLHILPPARGRKTLIAADPLLGSSHY